MDTLSRHASSVIDPKLMAQVVKGDHQAFSQLYDQSSALLFTLALRILGNRDEAAELLQDIYLEIWRKVARYDVGRGTPMAWLVTLTRSRAIDRLRARASKTPPGVDSTEPSLDHLPDQSPDPFEIQADHELRNAVGKALAELPEAQRQALELAYYEGLSHTDIAARLNQPVGTIKTRIKLGMNKLRAALRGCSSQGEAR